jgi:hypothetical protein
MNYQYSLLKLNIVEILNLFKKIKSLQSLVKNIQKIYI